MDLSDFQVHVGERIEPEQRERLGQLLRYQVRPPVDLVRLAYDEASGVVRYGTQEGHDLVWSHPTAFLADYCQHVPEPRAARVSYHGFLASCKGNLGPPTPPGEDGQAEDPGRGTSGRRRCRIPWALLVWRVWNADAERCNRCQRETVRTAVLVERVEFLRLLVALRIQAPPCRPPPVPLPEIPAETVQGRERWGRRRRPPPPPRPSWVPPSGDDGFAQEPPREWATEQPALLLDWPDEVSQRPPGW